MKKFKLFKMLAVLIVLITSVSQVWGYGSAEGTVVYFDKQSVTSLFTTGPYLRRGNTGYSEAPIMSKVDGTKYLYSYTMGAFEYDAISIANGYGWTGNGDDKSIYQPSNKQYGKEGYSGGAVISQQTEYYKENISGNFYIKPSGSEGDYDYGCRYYKYTHGSLPYYSVTYGQEGSHGTLSVTKCTGDENTDGDYTTFDSGDDTFLPTQIIKIHTTADCGYRANLSVTGATLISEGKYYVTANCTISVSFSETYAYVEGRFHVTNEARDGSWTNTFSDGDWDEGSTRIKFDYDATNKVFYKETWATPKELSTDISGHGPVFYVKTSTSSSSLSSAYSYWSATQQTLSAAGKANKRDLTQTGDFHNDYLKFNSTDQSGWVILYFDEKSVWYEVVPWVFTGATDTDWDRNANWTPNQAPTNSSELRDVVIEAPVVVNVTNAYAKSVKIYNDGDTKTGKLTIGAGKALVVAEDIKKTTDGSTKIATTADVLHIEAGTSSVANGALVWGLEGTPGAAQVDFYTKSHGEMNSSASINQYIGTPFSDKQQIHYQYYYSWMYKIARDGNGDLSWDLMDRSEGMNAYEGYNFITAYEAGTTYQLDGTLVSNADMTLTTSTTPALVYSGSGTGASPKNENVLANSWVAPIHINSMDAASNFKNVEGSIYIFNAGTPGAYTGNFAEDKPGNYTAYSIGTAASTDVIPSMQSFSVFTNNTDPSKTPSITFNYDAWVKTPLSTTYNNSANKAPRRNKADEMKLLKVRVQGENGWADVLKIYTYEEFSMDFEDSWDAHKMYGYPETPQLYAISTDGALAISCVPTADNNVLGFQPGTEDSEYTFSFQYNGDETLYLNDTKAGVSTQINEENTYDFTSTSEDNVARFTISKSPVYKVPTGVENTEAYTNSASKLMINGVLHIIRDGRIYNAEGTLVK